MNIVSRRTRRLITLVVGLASGQVYPVAMAREALTADK